MNIKKMMSRINDSQKKMEINGLRQCLRSFDNNGEYATNRHWKIAGGGYDLTWQLYYDNIPVVDCVGDDLELDREGDYTNEKDMIKIILQEYDWCRYRKEVYVVTYTDDSGIYDDEVETYSQECDDYSEAKRFMSHLKEEGFVDVDYEKVYYDVDGNRI